MFYRNFAIVARRRNVDIEIDVSSQIRGMNGIDCLL